MHIEPAGAQDRYNVLVYLVGEKDATISGSLNALSRNGINVISKDFVPGYEGPLRGNPGASQFIQDYDDVISLCRKLVTNFEINEPLGFAGDVDWVGRHILEVFGDGWAGPPTSWPHGHQFTKRSKKEVFQYITGLAEHGWKGRVSTTCVSLPPLNCFVVVNPLWLTCTG